MNKYTIFKIVFTWVAIITFCLTGEMAARADINYSSSNNTAANNSEAIANRTNKSLKTKTLEAGATLLQDTTPVKQLTTYLDGFHSYKSEADRPKETQHQMRVSHYCKNLNEDLIQCAIYDGNMKNAHLIGIEYVVSDRVYRTLPDQEKPYWHSHVGEVDGGVVMAPGIPEPAHKALMDKMRTTHGKTWHTWDPQKTELPFGEPSLMWAIEPDQINSGTKNKMEERKKSINF